MTFRRRDKNNVIEVVSVGNIHRELIKNKKNQILIINKIKMKL